MLIYVVEIYLLILLVANYDFLEEEKICLIFQDQQFEDLNLTARIVSAYPRSQPWDEFPCNCF
jgi:hypothetical protein